jgi:hypothetical protein
MRNLKLEIVREGDLYFWEIYDQLDKMRAFGCYHLEKHALWYGKRALEIMEKVGA